jgi:hypothetical protein
MAATLSSLSVEPRFSGAPGEANGGWIAGLLARELGQGAATVRFQAGVPLDRTVDIEPAGGAGGGVRLVADGVELVRAEPSGGPVVAPMPLAPGELLRAGGRHDHPFPTCFVCGPDRAAGDGLRLAPSPVRAGVAARWTPDEDSVVEPFLWAVLDCPSAFAVVGPGDVVVMESITARVQREPEPGRELVVAAGELRREGRTRKAMSALYDGRALVAVAETTWRLVS